MRFKQQGFTLVELIIVVAIIGILGSIVYPSYTNYVVRANRVDAKIALSTLAQLQERYYTENLEYTDDFHDLLPSIPSGKSAIYVNDAQGSFSADEDGQDYKITLSHNKDDDDNDLDSTYTLTAVANSTRQLKDSDCKSFVLKHTGLQSSQDTDGTDSTGCWDR